MKIAIIYASIHHHNTQKIIETMNQVVNIEMIDIMKTTDIDISQYHIIGFASGIYFFTFHKKLKEFIKQLTFSKHQKVFLISTCGIKFPYYVLEFKNLLKQQHIQYLGHFQCLGYDTFGIFGKIGGIAKNHPNQKDLQKAQQFIKKIEKEGSHGRTNYKKDY